MVTQLEEKNRESVQLAESLQQELTDKVNMMNETCSEEMAQLHAEVSGLNAEKVSVLTIGSIITSIPNLFIIKSG